MAAADGESSVVIEHPSGARATIHLHGAHLTSWVTGDGQEQIFLSRQAVFAPPKAIRGGVPICFPQFSDIGSLSTKHGFARNCLWKLKQFNRDRASFVLRSTPEIKRDFGYGSDFEATITYGVDSGKSLSTVVQVTNNGSERMTFGIALHTYYRVRDIHRVKIEGLYGCQYMDSLEGRELKLQSEPRIVIDKEVDRIYLSTPPNIKLIEAGAERVLTVAKSNLPDTVVWNPWVEKSKAMGDFGDEEYKEMVCIETSCIKPPVELEPKQKWKAEQIVTLS